jgi:hypothetical protein
MAENLMSCTHRLLQSFSHFTFFELGSECGNGGIDFAGSGRCTAL